MHVGARYYDAQVGLLISRYTDLAEKPYLYCEHDPVNNVDPTGHGPITMDWCINFGTAIAERNWDQVGTMLTIVTDEETANACVGAMQKAILLAKMSTSVGRLKEVGQFLKNIRIEAVKVMKDPPTNGPQDHHLGEITTFTKNIGQKLRLK